MAAEGEDSMRCGGGTGGIKSGVDVGVVKCRRKVEDSRGGGLAGVGATADDGGAWREWENR